MAKAERATNTGWDQLFDFSTTAILDWEVDQIRADASNDSLIFEDHVIDAGIDDGVDIDDMLDVILKGAPLEKDLPNNNLARRPGIAFDWSLWRHARTKVKVGEYDARTYEAVTTHEF